MTRPRCSGFRCALAQFLVAAVLAAPALVLSAAPSIAPVAHWRFDELAGNIVSDSAGGFVGVLSPGGASFAPGNGIAGGALSLDQAANGFADFGNALPLTDTSFTVVAWVKMRQGNRTPSSAIVCKQLAGMEQGYVLWVNNSGGNYGRDDRGVFCVSDSPGQELSSQTPVNDGVWHQIVGVYNKEGQKYIYVDGGQSESSNASQPVVQSNAPLLIGGWHFGRPKGMFTGLIDDVQIYDRALAEDEIAYLFANPGLAIPSGGILSHREGVTPFERVTILGKRERATLQQHFVLEPRHKPVAIPLRGSGLVAKPIALLSR